MRNIVLVIILALITPLLSSCNKDDNEKNVNKNCVFVQNDDDRDGIIDETERMIMNDCIANSLSSKSTIQNNLIGIWELIGHGEGWIPTKSQPCGYIEISDNELTFEFKNAHIDTVTTHLWEIEEVNWPGGQYYRLKIAPEYVEGLFITQFCDDYMFGDATPSDGNMYLYKKIN